MPTKRMKAKVSSAVKTGKPQKKSVAKVAPVMKKTDLPVSAATPAKKYISAEDKFKLIEKEAFLLAEKDGFRGDPLHFWVAAEKMVNQQYK